MQPTFKAEKINKALFDMFGIDRVAAILTDTCTTCQKDADTFRDDRSRREFQISGMCQACQDEFFKSGGTSE